MLTTSNITLHTAIVVANDTANSFNEDERPAIAEALTAQIGFMYGLKYGMKHVRVYGMIYGFKPIPADDDALIAELSAL